MRYHAQRYTWLRRRFHEKFGLLISLNISRERNSAWYSDTPPPEVTITCPHLFPEHILMRKLRPRETHWSGLAISLLVTSAAQLDVWATLNPCFPNFRLLCEIQPIKERAHFTEDWRWQTPGSTLWSNRNYYIPSIHAVNDLTQQDISGSRS